MHWTVLLNMIVIMVNKYTWTVFFFYIIEEVVMIVTISQKTPKFLVILINHYVETLLI